MPARDAIHDAVRNALVKDDWTIIHDPYILEFEELIVFPDLAADRSLAAEREDERVVIEAKTFEGRSVVYELEHAVGQYQLYRILLRAIDSRCKLFLCVTQEVYENIFQRPGIECVIRELDIGLLVIDPEREVIVKWTS